MNNFYTSRFWGFQNQCTPTHTIIVDIHVNTALLLLSHSIHFISGYMNRIYSLRGLIEYMYEVWRFQMFVLTVSSSNEMCFQFYDTLCGWSYSQIHVLKGVKWESRWMLYVSKNVIKSLKALSNNYDHVLWDVRSVYNGGGSRRWCCYNIVKIKYIEPVTNRWV